MFEILKISMAIVIALFLLPVVYNVGIIVFELLGYLFFGVYKDIYKNIKTHPVEWILAILFWFINPVLFVSIIGEHAVDSYFPIFFLLNIVICLFLAYLIGAYENKKLKNESNDTESYYDDTESYY